MTPEEYGMQYLVIGGERVPYGPRGWLEWPGCMNHLDHPGLRLRMGEDMRMRRTRWVRNIVVHNTKAIPTTLLDGAGKFQDIGERLTRYWATSPAHAGAHFVIDHDGTVTQHADPLLHAAYHASVVNDVSIGIEIYEDSEGRIYQAQLDSLVRLVEWLCRQFGIQRQCIPVDHRHPIDRCMRGAQDIVGVIGHRNITASKAPGDPGDHAIRTILSAGFMAFSYATDADLQAWRRIQGRLPGIHTDGIPGPATCDALREAGFEHGLIDWNSDLAL